jgi:hypothetical protein
MRSYKSHYMHSQLGGPMKALFYIALGVVLYWAYEHPGAVHVWADYLNHQLNQLAAGRHVL